MVIISVSIPEELVKELDGLQKDMDTGRSDVIRAGIRHFVQEQKQQLGDNNSAVLMVTHQDQYDQEVSYIKASYEDIIKTHLHNKIGAERCVDVFVLEGTGTDIRAVTDGFLTNRKMDNVKLVVL